MSSTSRAIVDVSAAIFASGGGDIARDEYNAHAPVVWHPYATFLRAASILPTMTTFTTATTLAQSVAAFRAGTINQYRLRDRVDVALASLLASPQAERATALAALATSGDPVLVQLGEKIAAALSGGPALVLAGDVLVKTLITKDPVKVERALISVKQRDALVAGLDAPPATAEALNELARGVSGGLPDNYKASFKKQREALIPALEEASAGDRAAAIAMCIVNAYAAQLFSGGNKAAAAEQMDTLVELVRRGGQGAKIVTLGREAAERLHAKGAGGAPVGESGPVHVADPITLSIEAKTTARREIRAAAAKGIFPAANGGNRGTHGYLVSGENAKALLEMARAPLEAPIDTAGTAILALLDTSDECSIHVALVDGDGHVAKVGECTHDQLGEWEGKTTKPTPEHPDGFQGAYLLLKDGEYFGLGAKGRSSDDFDIAQFKTRA